MTVDKVLNRLGQDLVTCRPEDTVETFAQLLASHRIGAVPVRDMNGNLAGIVSERDIVRAFAKSGGDDIRTLIVQDIMTDRVVTVEPSDTMERARQLMTKHGVRHLPVVRDSKIIGILSIRDMLETRLEEAELERNVLRDNVIAARAR